jgi:outer membrane receptor for ferrienterochelin and colicins
VSGRVAFVVVALVASSGVAANAQRADTTKPATLAPMVSTVSRRLEDPRSAVVAVSVITREAIAAMGATDVAAALAQQSMIQLDGGVPSGSGIAIQGMTDQRVLVLVDGQPVVGRVNGNFDLSRIPTAMVERIEIVAGPQSVLYGSDAMGGVINVVTRAPGSTAPARRLATGISTTAGSHDRIDVSTWIESGALSPRSYRLDLGRRQVALMPGMSNAVGTRAERWDVAPRLVWRDTRVGDVDVGGVAVLERQRYRSGQLFTFSDNSQLVAHVGTAWRSGVHRIAPQATFTAFDHLSRASTTGRPVSSTGASDIQRLARAEMGYAGRLGGALIDAGGEMRRESISADRVDDRNRVLGGAAAFSQATWATERLTVAPGLRYEWSEQWGTAFTPRLALMARPVAGRPFAVRLSAARGFRAPDFKELYLEFVNASAGYAVRGNPELRPERSTNVSADVDWRAAGAEVRVNAFRNVFTDFIETVGPDATGTFSYRNTARGRTSGGGTELRWNVRSGGVAMRYDYLRARDANTEPLLGRATHAASIAATGISIGMGLRGTLSASHTGWTPTQRDDAGEIVSRAPFTRVDARVARPTQIPTIGGVELSLGATNVLNQTPGGTWPGFTGRQFFGGMSWSAK